MGFCIAVSFGRSGRGRSSGWELTVVRNFVARFEDLHVAEVVDGLEVGAVVAVDGVGAQGLAGEGGSAGEVDGVWTTCVSIEFGN